MYTGTYFYAMSWGASIENGHKLKQGITNPINAPETPGISLKLSEVPLEPFETPINAPETLWSL